MLSVKAILMMVLVIASLGCSKSNEQNGTILTSSPTSDEDWGTALALLSKPDSDLIDVYQGAALVRDLATDTQLLVANRLGVPVFEVPHSRF